MRILGLDVGQRRIGVAVSDSLGLTAQGLTVVQRRATEADAEAISRLAKEQDVSTVVVGLPLTLEGRRGPQADRVASFAEALQRVCGLPVVWVDERFTTAQGERALLAGGASRKRRKDIVDQVAAQLILQAYLDAHRPAA
ncbi:MAG: Holliday junction resolvase RuvX [Candidatus Omnitrophica bacterium]|nr:Holliday junction resolvase RuvX [Candidatus Omnitrophota bacterium]